MNFSLRLKDGFGSKICALCLRMILFKREITSRDETIRSSHDTIRIDTKEDDMIVFDTIRYG